MASQKTRDAWRAGGLCGYCGAVPDQHHKTCRRCRDRVQRYHEQWVAREKQKLAAGVVTAAGERKVIRQVALLVLSSSEVAQMPAGVRVFPRCWLRLRLRLLKERSGARRVIANAMLEIMAEIEQKARQES